MRAELKECEGCFMVEFIAETLEDAARLVSMKMNSVGAAQIDTYASSMGANPGVTTYIRIQKHKRACSSVPSRTRKK